MIGCVSSVVLVGVGPRPRRVELFVGRGGPSICRFGLRDAAVRGAKGRVLAALQSSEFTFLGRRIVANLDELLCTTR